MHRTHSEFYALLLADAVLYLKIGIFVKFVFIF